MKKHAIYYLLLIIFPLATQTMESSGAEFHEEYTIGAESENVPDPDNAIYIEKIKNQFRKLTKRKTDFNDPKWTHLLRHACSYEECSPILEALLEKNIPTDVPDLFGSLPLYHACSLGCLKNVALLLKYKADPHLRSCSETCLMAAVEGGSLEVVAFLLQLEAIDVNAQRFHSGSTALMYAVQDSIMLDRACKKDQDLRKNIVTALLDAGADATIVNDFDQTAMAIARNNNFDDLAEFLENQGQKNNALF